jgi:predicted nucleotidyltransferase
MDLEKIKEKVFCSPEYDFIVNNQHLGSNIILLGLGGSHAYGTNIETSDIDVRGVALNTKQEILTNDNFEQFTNEDTDTTIYSFNKIITLLSNCNPNTIEILGLKPEHYLFLSPIGKELLGNKKLFLSKRAVNSFGGYANQQLRRLSNKAARLVGQTENEQYILKSIEHAKYDFKEKYFDMPDDAIRLYTDKAVQEDYNT